jgi:phospholipase/carboxylesterase
MKRIMVLVTALLLSMRAPAQLMEDLSLKYLVHLPSEQTNNARTVILLHGYGSNEQDLFGLRSAFPGNCIIISARAPLAAGPGYEWFDIGSVNQPQIVHSRELTLKFIEEVKKKYSVDPKEIYVMGFSQGAMMSYEVGLTHPNLIKGIGVLSGRLFPALKEEIQVSAELKRLRIFISHGTKDDRIKYEDGKAAADYLTGIGLKPEFYAYKGMGHAINEEVMKDLIQWLGK